MEIKSLKDLKVALQDIPNDFLEDFGAGFPEDSANIKLLVWGDDSKFAEKWERLSKEFPIMKEIDKWIQNIGKVQLMMERNEHHDTFGFEEMVSSEDDIEDDKKSSHNQSVQEKFNLNKRLIKENTEFDITQNLFYEKDVRLLIKKAEEKSIYPESILVRRKVIPIDELIKLVG